MKFWQSLAFTEMDQIVEVAKISEEVGFDGILISDHLFLPAGFGHEYPYSEDGDPGFAPGTPWPDAWMTISAMAQATSRIRFCTMVYILPLRNPIEVAKVTGTAAVLSNNRVALGAGAGWMKEEFETLGVEFSTRGKRFNECIEVLRKLHAGGTVEHHGDFFDFDPLEMEPAPTRPVPILIGGISKVALRRAATRGDGWLGSGQTPDEALDLLGQIAAFRKEAGRQNEPFEAVCPLVTPPTADDFRRLEDAGASGTVSYPFSYSIGPTSTLDAKRAYLEGYAENVIQKMG